MEGSARKTITRADVARYAGVSTAVVSYTLNNGPKPVAPATAERVRNAVAVLGYRPNAAARALKRGSSDMIGLVVPDSSNPFYAELAQATEEAAAARGYALVVINGNDTNVVWHVNRLASRQVDGILVACDLQLVDIAKLTASGVRLSLFNQLHPTVGTWAIGSDLFTGTKAGVAHLQEHGHTRIAFVGNTIASDSRLRGWEEAMREAGLTPEHRFQASYSREGGYAAAQQLAAAFDAGTVAERPSAVFVSTDMQALGVLRALHERGIRVPEDMAVVSLDGTPEAEYSWPALTTLRQPVREMAVAAVAHLLGDAAAADEHQLYPLELVVRQSCGCPRG
jgi:LacI family transcriptional regulator